MLSLFSPRQIEHYLTSYLNQINYKLPKKVE